MKKVTQFKKNVKRQITSIAMNKAKWIVGIDIG